MFCRKCGQELPDDAMFCVRCGIPTDAIVKMPNAAPSNNFLKDSKRLLRAIIGIAGVCLVIGVIFFVIVFSQHNRIRKMEEEINQSALQRATLMEEKISDIAPTPVTTSTPMDTEIPVYKDDYIIFGQYEQDGDTANGAEPIEWRVLAEEGNRKLLISLYVLDLIPYDNTNNKEITWEKCNLRNWLNSDFFETAFTNDAQKFIETTYIENRDNKRFGTYGGEDTTDKIFILDDTEIYEYFNYTYWEDEYLYGMGEDIIALGSEYLYQKYPYDIDNWIITEDTYDSLKKKGYSTDCIGKKGVRWWQRTPGQNSSVVTMVWEDGSVGNVGTDPSNDFVGVRPAMWIKMPNDVSTLYSTSDLSHDDVIKGNDTDLGIRSEVKEAIDSYESFIDSYCVFMKSYDSSNWTMVSEYSEYMTKYYETTVKFDAIADMDLNDVEQMYYTEVALRCSEKMLKVASEMK